MSYLNMMTSFQSVFRNMIYSLQLLIVDMQCDSTENAVPCGKIEVIKVDKSNSKLANIGDPCVGAPVKGPPRQQPQSRRSSKHHSSHQPPSPGPILSQIYSHQCYFFQISHINSLSFLFVFIYHP